MSSAGKLAQWVKCLVCTPENPSLNPRTHLKKKSVGASNYQAPERQRQADNKLQAGENLPKTNKNQDGGHLSVTPEVNLWPSHTDISITPAHEHVAKSLHINMNTGVAAWHLVWQHPFRNHCPLFWLPHGCVCVCAPIRAHQ